MIKNLFTSGVGQREGGVAGIYTGVNALISLTYLSAGAAARFDGLPVGNAGKTMIFLGGFYDQRFVEKGNHGNEQCRI